MEKNNESKRPYPAPLSPFKSLAPSKWFFLKKKFFHLKKVYSESGAGFTLIEVVVSVAIFAILAIIVFQVYALIINEIRAYRDKAIVASLANQYIETVRNLPYANIGTVHGSTCDKPEGEICSLPDSVSPVSVDFGGVVYNVYYSISYVDDPADGTVLEGTDTAPNDYKQVKLYVQNTSSGVTKDFLTIIAPKGIETLGNRGVLSVKVFNAVGQPVQGAFIHIVNNNLSPTFDVTRTSGSDGSWLEVGVKPSINGYNITVTKNGYSSDYTSIISEQNPNPTKPDATILVGEVTQVSFSIDLLSNLTLYTQNQTCQIMSGIDFEVRGDKLIGTSPSVYKFDKDCTSNASGAIYPASDPCNKDGKCLEWDTYTPAPLPGSYMVYGTIPAQAISILPNTSQDFNLILGPYTANSMLVMVKDSGLGTPIEGASVILEGPINKGPLITGGSVWGQQDWSSAFDSYNVSTLEIPYALRLAKIGDDYVGSGWLESSTFDTGTEETIYTTLEWQPISQTSGTEIKFQIATNNDNETWNFAGPDGTGGTYYTASGNTISFSNNNNRYVRYKVFLSTADPAVTPVLTSVSLNYISRCYTPGQVMFPGLVRDINGGYQVTVSKTGYQTQIVEGLNVDGYGFLEVLLTQLII